MGGERAWAELSHQARRVVAWVEWVTLRRQDRMPGTSPTSPVVVIQNSSEEPIHDCVIRISVARKHWEEIGSRELVERRPILPPGRSEILVRGLGLYDRDPSQLPALWFTDSANIRWARSHTGKLARVVDRGSMRGASRWRRVLWRRRPVGGPAVVEDQAPDVQDAEAPGPTNEAPATGQ